MLLRYFGEKNEHNCGHCDICLQKHPCGLKQGEFMDLKEYIIQSLSTEPCSAAEIGHKVSTDKEKLEQVLSFLLSEEIINQKNGILYI